MTKLSASKALLIFGITTSILNTFGTNKSVCSGKKGSTTVSYTCDTNKCGISVLS